MAVKCVCVCVGSFPFTSHALHIPEDKVISKVSSHSMSHVPVLNHESRSCPTKLFLQEYGNPPPALDLVLQWLLLFTLSKQNSCIFPTHVSLVPSPSHPLLDQISDSKAHVIFSRLPAFSLGFRYITQRCVL